MEMIIKLINFSKEELQLKCTLAESGYRTQQRKTWISGAGHRMKVL